MIEIRVKIKNENRSGTYKDMIYDQTLLNLLEAITKPFLDDSVKAFGDDPEKVSYSLHKVIQ